jgi:Mg2+/Co2+ transporter CorC
MQLELSDVEREVLEDVLERVLGDLREEIYKTDTADFKHALKGRESVIKALLARLRAPSL